MNFFRKIFDYINDLSVGELRCRMLVILGVIIIVDGILSTRHSVMEFISFGLFCIVAGILAEYVGKSVRRKINRKKDLEDLENLKRFKYD